MLTGILAARNVAGEDHDVWAVNIDEEYHEETTSSDRLTPGTARHGASRMSSPSPSALRSAGLGSGRGDRLRGGLFLATVLVLIDEPGDPGRVLSLLGQYLVGYEVSWANCGIGLLGAGLGASSSAGCWRG